ncbi:hypothetical protein [Polaribacter sp. Q13]|uniref:hypothetical protein n=1 Tax=Polaribacter sp. Q13 TaxID=2806551 RepID=UPI00193B1CDA|nr:hypothetical protein [Polaribacter sp. Q13]QVY67063.1 hypothetical protein JOP69_07245 [Polaribacter sp. Q13]
MENPASISLGVSNLFKYCKKEFYNSKIVLNINLVILLIIHLFMVYQLFYKNVIINFFDYKFGIILFILYLGYTYFPLYMVLVEFGIWKKSTLNTKFLNYTKQLLESSEKRHSKPNETTKLKDEVAILNKKTSNNKQTIKSVKDNLTSVKEVQTTFIKEEEFKPVRNLVNKNTSDIVTINNKTLNNKLSINSLESNIINIKKDLKTSNSKIDANKLKIEDHLLKKEKLTTLNGFTKSKFEVILNTFQKNLFPSIKTNHFSDFAFTEKTETFKGKIKEPELKKFIQFLKVLQLNQVIGKNKTRLSKVIKHYFQLNEEHDTINRWVNPEEYRFLNEKTVKQIESYIPKKNKKNPTKTT